MDGSDWDAPVRSWLASLRFSASDEDEWIVPPQASVEPTRSVRDRLLRETLLGNLHTEPDMPVPCCCPLFASPSQHQDQECPLVSLNESLPAVSTCEPRPARPPPLVFALSRISEASDESVSSPLNFARLSYLSDPHFEFVPLWDPSIRRSFQRETVHSSRLSWPDGLLPLPSSKALIRSHPDSPLKEERSCAYVSETLVWNDALLWSSSEDGQESSKVSGSSLAPNRS